MAAVRQNVNAFQYTGLWMDDDKDIALEIELQNNLKEIRETPLYQEAMKGNSGAYIQLLEQWGHFKR